MGTSKLPCSVSSSSFTLPPSLDDLLPSSAHLSTHTLTPESSSTSGSSSSSSSSSLDPRQRRSFLRNHPLDGFHLQAPSSLSPVGSPVISSTSASKEKPESPFNTTSSCVSAMSNFSMPHTNATDSSVPHRFQSFEGGFNQLANTNVMPSDEKTPSYISSILTSAEAASIALSSPASAGAGVTKVSKRRARINKKAPIAVLSADPSNFRAMVQQLTGIPPSHASFHIWGTSGAPLLRPQPTRFAYNGDLPTLDTSASFLNHKQIFPFLQGAQQPLINEFLSGGASNSAAEHTHFQGRGNMMTYDALSGSFTSLPGLWDAMSSGSASGNHMKGNVKELSAASLVRECEQTFPRQSSNLFNTVDSWLAFDGGVLASHSPRVDLAKIAS